MASVNRKQSIGLLKKYSTQFSFPSSDDTNSNFPVLKIEEDDLDDITMTNNNIGVCKTTSTQTSPVNERTTATTTTTTPTTPIKTTGNGNNRNGNKKGSASSLWSSEESILRSAADTVDEDNKSTSSSACDETGGAISSGKSGKQCIFYYTNVGEINKKQFFNVLMKCYFSSYKNLNLHIFVVVSVQILFHHNLFDTFFNGIY